MGSTANVSWSKPFGDSALAQIGGGIQDKLFGTDRSIVNIVPLELKPGTAKRRGHGQEIPDQQPPAGGGAALASQNLGFHPTPTNDTSGEDAFRQTYLSALKPQTAFTFNAQNPSAFGAAGNPQARVGG